jgi:hypothetical protein
MLRVYFVNRAAREAALSATGGYTTRDKKGSDNDIKRSNNSNSIEK